MNASFLPPPRTASTSEVNRTVRNSLKTTPSEHRGAGSAVFIFGLRMSAVSFGGMLIRCEKYLWPNNLGHKDAAVRWAKSYRSQMVDGFSNRRALSPSKSWGRTAMWLMPMEEMAVGGMSLW